MQPVTISYSSNEHADRIPSIIQALPLSVPRPPAIAELINGQLASIWISLRLQHLNSQWLDLLKLFSVGDVHNYQFALESTLVSMKRVIDDLIMCAYCIHKEAEIVESRKIDIDGWGVLFRKGVPTSLGQEIIDRFVGEYDEFPDILNDLVNAMKHSYLMAEARSEWNNEFPLVKVIYSPRNDYSGVVQVHDHDMRELVLGFNKFVRNTLVKTHPYSVGPTLPLNF